MNLVEEMQLLKTPSMPPPNAMDEEGGGTVVARRAVLGGEAESFRKLVLSKIDESDFGKCSTVYSTVTSSEESKPNLRQCRRVTLSDPNVFEAIEHLLLPRILPGKATAVCRTHYDVILYEKGDFFAPHRDFVRVRVSSGSVVQYFGLYSLLTEESPTCKGGETVVNGVAYDTATFPDGALVCPAEFLHEATPVTAGQKIVLKFDFLRLTDIDNDALLLRQEQCRGSASSQPPATERIICADGAEKIVDRNLLKAVPFFTAALQFPRMHKDALNLKGMESRDFDALLDYLKGGGRCPQKPEELLNIMDAMCMQEVAAAPGWSRFLAGAPVFVPEEAVVPLWEQTEPASVVPFVTVTVQTKSSSAVICAVAILPRGKGLPLKLPAWALPLEDLFLTSDSTTTTPRGVAEHAVKVLSMKASKSGEDTDVVRKSHSKDLHVKALKVRAPLLLEMLQQESTRSSTETTRLVEEQEYCNDGHCDVFWNYETLLISYRFALFRIW